MDHLILVIELDSHFVCLTLFVNLLSLKLDFLSAEDHEVMEDLEVLVEVSPFEWSSLLQELNHLMHESDTDGLGDLVSLVLLLTLLVNNFLSNVFHLFGESDLFLL